MSNVKTVKSNTTKSNTNLTIDYELLKNELLKCETKHQLVDCVNRFGIRTTTKPTDTHNINDLYIQFDDQSRIKLQKTSFFVYTNQSVIDDNKTLFSKCTPQKVNDGKYRNVKVKFDFSVANLKKIIEYMLKNANNILPTNN